MLRRRHLLALALAPAAAAAQSPLRLLSAGALEPGVAELLRLWHARGGVPVRHAFNTAPRIAERLAAGEQFDVLFATRPLVEGLGPRLLAPAHPLGSVGVGIAIRQGAPAPAITDEASLRAAVEAANAVVFNRASTGLYMDRLFARLGLTASVAPKEVRFPDGDAVLRRIAGGSGQEIGFAAITEILLFRDKGVAFPGPLPPALQNRTAYEAALLAEPARAFFAFVSSAEARAALVAAGID
jgi:molybdate transport system substrate-binding protein